MGHWAPAAILTWSESGQLITPGSHQVIFSTNILKSNKFCFESSLNKFRIWILVFSRGESEGGGRLSRGEKTLRAGLVCCLPGNNNRNQMEWNWSKQRTTGHCHHYCVSSVVWATCRPLVTSSISRFLGINGLGKYPGGRWGINPHPLKSPIQGWECSLARRDSGQQK